MSIVRERTQNEIIAYIRTHSKDGRLTKSMLDIANQIGYSNATVHRALKALEEKGLIEITESSTPTKPNTIIFKGESSEMDELLAEGVRLSEQLQGLASDVHTYVQRIDRFIRKADKQPGIAMDRIIAVADIPNTEMQMVTVRKEV